MLKSSMHMHVSSPKIPSAHVMQCLPKSDICFNSKSCEQDQKDQVQGWEIELIMMA
jgi:hypothetical protein